MPETIRSKKKLEILLQNLKKPTFYRNELEQYPTDASLASDILFLALLDGNIEGKTVGDFGAGNGVLGIGAAMLGASKAICVEIDGGMAATIRENSGSLNVEVFEMDISNFQQRVDTVVMNPPFGSVVKGADRIFLEKAAELSSYVYSIHNIKSADFVRKFYAEHGEIVRESNVRIRTPRLYSHHTSDLGWIDGVFFTAKFV